MQLLLKVSESVLVCQIKQNRIIALVFWNACDGEMANLYIKVYTRWLNHVELQANGYSDFEIDFIWPARKSSKGHDLKSCQQIFPLIHFRRRCAALFKETVMPVTSWCWWRFVDVGAEFRWHHLNLGGTNVVPNAYVNKSGFWWSKTPSTTSHSFHQDISSPTSVINIV